MALRGGRSSRRHRTRKGKQSPFYKWIALGKEQERGSHIVPEWGTT